MTNRTQAGMVQTVLGPIRPQELGVTLPHEHLLIDMRAVRGVPTDASARELYDKPVSLETLGYIRYHFAQNADNSRLSDVEAAVDEATLYEQHGGGTLVDVTSVGIARDPVGLAHISRETGVNVIMGSSYYVEATHPPDMDSRSEDDILGEIVQDITEGVVDTGIRAGIIGEVGCTWPLGDNERKVLRASARAQQLTGAPLLIHPGRDESAPEEIIDLLTVAGADLSRTIMGHLDRTVFERDTLKRVAESGCYLEWDLFGREQSYYPLNPKVSIPGDAKRIEDIAWAISEGYGDRVVVAHDIAAKERLLRYGGHGYFYLLAHIVPRMLGRGFHEDDIHKILVDNPAGALTFAEAKPPA